MNQEEARAKVAELLEKLSRLSHAVIQRDYQEANTRKDFILPLFRVLGWDVDNADEVYEERKAEPGKVDYAFRIRGVSRFYLEAKPLREDLPSHPEWEEKAVSYAYNKGIPWVVLTNFQDLWVYNADVDARRFITLKAGQYQAKFDLLWLLSKTSIETEALDAHASTVGAAPPKITVEKRLFEQLRQWRERLTNEILKYHPERQGQLELVDEAVQMFFNRLLFIRTCEDRRIEEPMLSHAVRQYQQGNVTPSLLERVRRVFRELDGSYDSELFQLHLLDQLFLEDPTLEEIITGLYRPAKGMVQYDFKLIDADILGRVYEQYLGHVAAVVKERARQEQQRLRYGGTPSVEIRLEAKRERRKAQGIYYTPKWVVDYIVQETVGRMLRELPYDQARQLRVLDPACGSGSFLIRAYDELLRWDAQNRTVAKSVDALGWQDRIAILTRHIFGVDLDSQAVEIARLNLLLKALAGRNTLPILEGNIKRGNSLVSGGEAELKPFFRDAWREKHPFNWEREFPAVMKEGGFDVVIGNPPYVRIQALPRDEADYYRKKYESAFGSFDIYVMFIERGLKLLKPGGRLGFITSGKFLKSEYGKKLQGIIRREAVVEQIIDLSEQRVFADATTYPLILVLQKGKQEKALAYVSVPAALSTEVGATHLSTLPKVEVEQDAILEGVWPPLVEQAKTLEEKLLSLSLPLGELSTHVFQGLITSADKVYILEKRGEPLKGIIKVYSKELRKELELEAGLLKPLLSGKHIERYAASVTHQVLLFPYKVKDGHAELLTTKEFGDKYPKCWQYLLANRQTLEGREGGKMRHERWYAYVYPKNLALHDFPKLAIPRLVHRLQVFYDAKGSFYLDNVDVGGLILKNASDSNYRYVLGLLNSTLLDWYFRQISAPFRGGFRSANRQFIERLPIRRLDLSKPGERVQHERVVELVQEMLELQQRLYRGATLTSADREELDRQIAQVDQAIDEAAYDLYGLTEEERRLVEESLQAPQERAR